MADSKFATSYNKDENYMKFSDKVRERYRNRQKKLDAIEWPPHFAEKLVKLILSQEVHNVYFNKKQRGVNERYLAFNRVQVEYDGIFQNTPGGTMIKKVLVEGDAGIGKTTLCTSISIEWAENKRLQQFDLLLLLPLREKEVTSVKTVVELLKLFYPDDAVCKSVADSFMQGSLGKNVLIIADGWDELEESLRKPESFIYRLLFEYNVIYFSTVMVTSRPSASVQIRKHPNIDRFIEIAGFDMKGIVQYIELEFWKKEEESSQNDLLQQIRNNTLIRSICHVPINCAIMCDMWRNDKSLPLNMTMTDMYTKIILYFIVRAFKKREFGLESLSSFDAIPEEQQECFWLLCEFAYNALVKDKFVFDYEEVENIFPQAVAVRNQHGDQQLFTFGLMQSSEAFLGIGRGASFHFIHRTFQEYLCAFHIVRQPQQIQTDLMKPHAYKSRMAMAMRFVIGIGSSSNHFSSKVEPLSPHTVCDVFKLDNRLRIACAGWTNDLVIHGICEAKESDVKHYLLNLVYGDSFSFVFPRNAYDCATVINAIKQFPKQVEERSPSARTVSFKLEHCHLDKELVKSLARALGDTKGRLKVKKLLIQDNKLCDRSICVLMELAAMALESLKDLNLAANSLGAEAISAISDHLGKSSIESLTLSYNSLDKSGALALQKVIKVDSLANLTDLQLKSCSLNTSEAYAALLNVLPDHCANLKQLDISENCIDNSAVVGELLGNLLLNHTNLSELYANEINFRDEGIKALTDVLNTADNETCMSILSIRANGIQPLGISLLVRCIQSSHLSVSDSFCVDGNPIHLKGVVSLASVLNTKSISISNCEMSACPEDVQMLSLRNELSEMPQSQLCEELILDNNCLSQEYVHILMELIRICPNLNNLSCAECEINTDDLKRILTHAKCNGYLIMLETWSLQNNKLDNYGCSLLITAVTSYLPKVNGILIHGNDIENKKLYRLLEERVAKHRVS